MPPQLAYKPYGYYICQSKLQNYKKYYKDKYSTEQTPSKLGVLQSTTFSHTPDEAMLG